MTKRTSNGMGKKRS